MIETQFVIKSIDVDKALQEAESKVDKSARKMDKDLNGAGSNTGKAISTTMSEAAKGMDAVAKAGGKIGGVFKNVTQAIMGVTNPIGMISAGITALSAMFVKMYEDAKKKIESLIHTYEWDLKQAQDRTSEMNKTHSQDNSYMKRLQEINNYETIDNATKQEAIRIIDVLTDRYGDLGLSIDATTGKIIGLTKAMIRQNELQRSQQINAARAEVTAQANVTDVMSRDIAGARPWKNLGRILSANDTFFEKSANAMYYDQFSRENVQDVFFGPDQRGYAQFGLSGDPEKVKQYLYSHDFVSPTGPMNIGKSLQEVSEEYRKQYNDAMRRYWQFNSGNVPKGILPEGYRPVYQQSKEIIRLQKEYKNLQNLAQNSTGEVAESYRREASVVGNMIQAMNKIEVSYEMQKLWANDEDEAIKWRKLYGEAQKYYVLLEKLRNYESLSRPEDPTIDIYKEQAQRIERQIDAQSKSLEGNEKRREQAEKNLNQTGYTKEQMYNVWKEEYKGYDTQIKKDDEALIQLENEYQKLNKELQRYDRYKNDKGEIVDPKVLQQYLDLSNQIRQNKLEQLELENKITNAETEQLNLQAKMKAYELEAAKARQDKLKEQMKNTLKNLFTNVLGDTKETTNDLTRRGGYLSNVNTINPLQVNRQILNTVITANNYLSAIKVAINNAGRI